MSSLENTKSPSASLSQRNNDAIDGRYDVKNKLLKKFWLLFPLFIIISLFIAFLFIPNNYLSLIPLNKISIEQKMTIGFKGMFYHYSIALLFFCMMFCSVLKILIDDQINRISTTARKVLPFEEYFDLKKSFNLFLFQPDIDYAAENITKEDIPDFIKIYQTKSLVGSPSLLYLPKISLIDCFFGLLTVLSLVAFFIHRFSYFVPDYLRKLTWLYPPYFIERGLIAFLCSVWLVTFLLKKFLIIYRFASKMDGRV